MAIVDLILPGMGEGITDATIIKWLKKPGDAVLAEETVLEIATDKVDSEVPSVVSGIVKELLFSENMVAPVGAVIARIETGETNTNAHSPAVPVFEKTPEEAIPYLPKAAASAVSAGNTDSTGNNGFFSPLVLNIARQEGILMSELEKITGSGAEGRVTKKDILEYIQVKNQKSKTKSNVEPEHSNAETTAVYEPSLDYSDIKERSLIPVRTSGAVEIIEMDRVRKLIAHHMRDSLNTSAHVSCFAEADVTNMVLWRNKIKNDFEKRENTRLTFTPLFIDCVIRALKKHPMLNSTLNGDKIILKKYINIGMATALPNGNLIVPVIPNADNLNLTGLSKAVNSLAENARAGKLKPSDTQDGTFTISNVGAYNSFTATAVINQPQAAILVTGSIKKRPVVIELPYGDTIGIRHIMMLSLTFDHRIIDGALGTMFLSDVVKEIENWDETKMV
ncbi:MAG: 2-oxo acid dehydrogenase subunit E2 [Chitinophagaceae bacterium]|jgi:2-oxoglutarate dehydrogenase E2 component (dihydrolipoamide succinyltransferase)|nr:2-oxo acid dehydrogenase subunit E2 [Chitinophagaceae bacterium]